MGKMKGSQFAQYGAEGSKRPFLGEPLKFTKGEWQIGADKDLVSPDKRFVPIMKTLTAGWSKWVDGKPVDARMGLVADGIRPLHRSELGDLNSETWEVDEKGNRVDLWQRTDLVALASASAPHALCTFSTSSVGGLGAIRDLCEAHARTTEGVGQYPVVTLNSDSYLHKIKSIGHVHVPIFNIVDCVEAEPFDAIVAGTRGGAGFMPASAAPLAIADDSGPIPGGLDLWNDNGAPPAPPVTEEPEGPGADNVIL